MAESQASDPAAVNGDKHFVVCVKNDEYEGALELRKIYEVLEDRDAEPHEMIRVIDESGEDYLYPRDWFVTIELPQNLEDVLLEIAHRQSA
ncbi:MAG TPA: hypothetical protein VGR95_13635 [Thermoanaerobaculia bacterium]|jgi:hypothetical protein|nr:hypothetical protein [Thermoanaerobaculia bacterium]